ncbi:hypothetical protein GCM10010140_56740 [Streptosporangium pseudovulgare]|uniref:Uncharacterized protein n=1 Tax=Streptosporangium pseudovulgare TaxID=35765 RepID=A0ABQ2RB53_9ACTN|nr:hypothetical protein GCM10010140_56740 [Streptosporangium pseudovulgare]
MSSDASSAILGPSVRTGHAGRITEVGLRARRAAHVIDRDGVTVVFAHRGGPDGGHGSGAVRIPCLRAHGLGS